MKTDNKHDWTSIRQAGLLRFVMTYGLRAGLVFASLMTIFSYLARTQLGLLTELDTTPYDVLSRYAIQALWFGSAMSLWTWYQNEKNHGQSLAVEEDAE